MTRGAGNDFSEMLDELFERQGLFDPARRITINDLRARKEAVRAGIGFTVVPRFAVREDVRNKALNILEVKGHRLPEAQLMLIEARRHQPAHVRRVRHAFLEKLSELDNRRRSG
jgi:DNA-binding transcriptional LysR family regulator